MNSPYTLTLHEAKHPDRPMHFSLDGDQFQMDLSALFVPAEPAPDAEPKDALEVRLEQMAQKIIQPFSGPTHVQDVVFLAEGDKVTIQAWKRTRGLRLAPVTVGLSEIDDPQAAAEFAARLKEAALASARPGKYTGPLDYWGSWLLMGLGALAAVVSLGWWLSRKSNPRRQ